MCECHSKPGPYVAASAEVQVFTTATSPRPAADQSRCKVHDCALRHRPVELEAVVLVAWKLELVDRPGRPARVREMCCGGPMAGTPPVVCGVVAVA